jgi:hypothetical protein
MQRRVATSLVAAAAVLALASSASAEVIRLGAIDPRPHDHDSATCNQVGVIHWVDDTPPNRDGDGYPGGRIPDGGGVITHWTTSQHPRGSQFRLVTGRRVQDGYIVRARSRMETVTVRDGSPQTFATHVKADGFDLIGLEAPDEGYFGDVCYYRSLYDNFVYLTSAQTDSNGFTQMVTGDGYDHARVNLQVRVEKDGPFPPTGGPPPGGYPAWHDPAVPSSGAVSAHRRAVLKRRCSRMRRAYGPRSAKARRACRKWHRARDAGHART